jgi:hypothetical protein
MRLRHPRWRSKRVGTAEPVCSPTARRSSADWARWRKTRTKTASSVTSVAPVPARQQLAPLPQARLDPRGVPRCVPASQECAALRSRPELRLPSQRRGLDPTKLAWAAQRRALWRCRTCGHEWTATVASRTAGGRGCPRCSRCKSAAATSAIKRRVAPERSIAVRRPDLLELWHPTLNGELGSRDCRRSLLAARLVALPGVRTRLEVDGQQPSSC